jgi:hypothetical protein
MSSDGGNDDNGTPFGGAGKSGFREGGAALAAGCCCCLQ